MPNCTMAERLNLEAIPDFHQFLRDYIDLQERNLQRLCGDMEFDPFESEFELNLNLPHSR